MKIKLVIQSIKDSFDQKLLISCFKFWLSTTLFTIGAISLTFLWEVSIEKVGFWKFVAGWTAFWFCYWFSEAVDKDNE